MENVIVVLILVAIAAGIIWYLISAKRKGEKCIGCPYAKQCGEKCSGGCSNKTDNGEN
ncbi:MAG: FeoB-associated Cys-rich membrane protein [Ruminococcaceae bacterium]|nr:FeoB-associated Cys-rich membrane protein [Oscillospiraceae bacterium]